MSSHALEVRPLKARNAYFCISILAISQAMIPVTVSAAETAQTFAYQGRLLDSAGTAPLTGLADLKFEVLNPAKDCVLYAESQNVDLGTAGAFAVQVGSVVGSGKRAANDAALSMAQVFTTSGSVTGRKVSDGTNCTYSPVAADVRYLRVTVTPQAGGPITLDPDQVIAATPQAIVAETVQGKTPLEFVQITGNGATAYSLSKTNLDKIFAAGDAQGLHHHDNEYVKIGGAASVGDFSLGSGKYLGLGSHLSDPVFSSGDAGKLWYNSTTKELKFNDGTAIQTMPVGSFEAPLTFSGDFSRTGNTIGLNTLDAGKVTAGVFGTARLGTGTADGSTFLRGDGVWAAPSASDSTKLPLTGGTLSGALNLGGNNLYGATSASGTLTLDSTSHATKGSIFLNPSGGNVGIGTTQPAAKLDVSGAIRLGSSATCDASTAGSVQFDTSSGHLKFCDGTGWMTAGNHFGLKSGMTLLMKQCPGGWTDNGGAGGQATCDGTVCRKCTVPSGVSKVPAGHGLAAESCPAGFTSKGIGSGGQFAFDGVIFQYCEASGDASLPAGMRIFADACPSEWVDLGTAAGGQTSCGASTCRVCQIPGANSHARVLRGGSGGSNGSPGGEISLIAGSGVDSNGGNVAIKAGAGATATATARNGGYVTLSAGNSVSGGTPGYITVQGGNNGAGIYGSVNLQASGGNVGIGTAIPDAKLQISGSSGSTLKIVDGNQGEGKVLTSDANGQASWQAPSGGPLTSCPAGMSMMGTGRSAYCIENTYRSAETYYDASMTCLNAGYYLCGFREWSVACQNGVGGNWSHNSLQYEWVSDPYGGSPSNAVVVGYGSCFKIENGIVTATNAFRCCQR